ncbi:MAG TPA: histidine kinase [Thermoanaerobaculia bacterium]|nr:histidine kinase [Thermoanaerobaculia bacterium]
MPNRLNPTLRWWLAMLAVAAALPLLLLVAWLFLTQLRSEQREARDRALRIAHAVTEQISELHFDSTALLQRMAARPSIRAADAGNCDSLFAIVDFFPQYLNLFLLDRTGGVICSATPQASDVAISDEARTWVQSDTLAGRFVPGEPRIRLIDGKWVAALATAVTGLDGTPAGSLVLVQLPEVAGSEDLPPGSVITIIDRAGTILVRSSDSERWIGRSGRGTEVTEIVLERGEGRVEARGVDGTSRQYGFTNIPDMGWYIYAGVPTEAVMAPVRELFLQGILAGAVIVALAVGASLALARFVQRPIDALAQAAGSIAREGYGGRVPMDGPREIAMLGEAFNEMIESRSQAEARIVASERNLKALSDRLLTVQEEERTRIAREIHDDLGQSLTALKMDLGGLLRTTEVSPATAPVRDRIVRTLDATVEAVQRISSELRPSALDDLGLAVAMEAEARLFEERTGIECDISVSPEGLNLPAPVATAVYRMIQEALTNVARHSNASRVEIRLRERSSELLLDVRDDGSGISRSQVEDRRSLGLIGIRERAAIVGGSVHFEGIEGRGTIVSVRIPLGGET